MKLFEDGTFSTYTAVYGRPICLKVLSHIPPQLDEETKLYLNIPNILKSQANPYVSFLLGDFTPLVAIANEMPLCSLKQAINSVQDIPWSLRIKIAAQIADAMKFLHSNNIVHGCLVPSDCLVMSLDENAPVHIRLADFGLNRRIFPTCVFAFDIIQWVAPEAFNSGTDIQKSADVYSFGIILWQLLTRKVNIYEEFNYSSENLVEFVEQGGRPEIPENNDAPNGFVELIQKCIQQDPALRPSFDEIIESKVLVVELQDEVTPGEPDSEIYDEIITLQPHENSHLIFDLPETCTITNISQLKPRDTWVQIGHGATSTVYLTHTESENENENEVKEIVVKEIYAEITNTEHYIARLKQLISIDHPNVAKYLGAFGGEVPLIFMEHLHSKDLCTLFEKNKPETIWENKGFSIAKDILAGLKYIHGLNPPLIHGNIKTTNILLDENWKAKIAGLDTSSIQRTAFVASTPKRRSVHYSSPEVIYNWGQTTKTDIFSVGVIIWELLTQQLAWSGMSNAQIASSKNKKLDIPENIPDNLKDLLERCWADDPESRPTAEELFNELSENSTNSPVDQS